MRMWIVLAVLMAQVACVGRDSSAVIVRGFGRPDEVREYVSADHRIHTKAITYQKACVRFVFRFIDTSWNANASTPYYWTLILTSDPRTGQEISLELAVERVKFIKAVSALNPGS